MPPAKVCKIILRLSGVILIISVLYFLRHIFLFDLAVIVCKRRGDNYEMKEIIDLQKYKITNNPTTDKENKKVSICC